MLLQWVDVTIKCLQFPDFFIVSKLKIASSILAYPLSSYVLILKMHLLCFLKCLLCESRMQVWMVGEWEQIKRQDDIHVVKIIFPYSTFLFISQVFISSHYPTQINFWIYRAPVVHLVAFGWWKLLLRLKHHNLTTLIKTRITKFKTFVSFILLRTI